jgi:hypothetical protein
MVERVNFNSTPQMRWLKQLDTTCVAPLRGTASGALPFLDRYRLDSVTLVLRSL